MKSMTTPGKIHVLQHVPFEGPGLISTWAEARGYPLNVYRVDEGELPPEDASGLMVIMGGPMGVGDDGDFPWLSEEKRWLRSMIESGHPMLGVCLGAQLIAHVLGAKVSPNPEKEIGWWPIQRAAGDVPSSWRECFPETLIPLHWHGDRFGIPEGAVSLYESEACPHQAFLYAERVLGLQFHIETTFESVENLIEHCDHELVKAPWIQNPDSLRAGAKHIPSCQSVLYTILDRLVTCP